MKNRTLRTWIGLAALGFALVACQPDAARKEAEAGQARERQRQIEMNQRLAGLQQQLAMLDKHLADLRVEHDRQIAAALQISQTITHEMALLRTQLAPVRASQAPAAGPAEPGAKLIPGRPAEVVYETPGPPIEDTRSERGHPLLRLILGVILLAAIWFIFKIFMGRWSDEGELDDSLTSDTPAEAAYAPEPPAPPADQPRAPDADADKQA